MIRKAVALVSIVLLVVPTFAQAPQSGGADDFIPSIRVTTKMVVVDAVVTDKAGHPVTDLKAEDFIVEENGKKQKVSSFANESTEAAAQKKPQDLPPNMVSNRPEYTMGNGPLTILILDALNTPVQNQQYARQEMLKYVANQLKPGQRVAVYSLTNHLIKLQNFTTDPSLLLAAIERFRTTSVAGSGSPAAGNTSSDMTAGNASVGTGRGGAGVITSISSAEVALRAFNADQAAQQLEARINTTLEAFRMIARSIAGHPGRKNLIWISAGLPFSLSPNAGVQDTNVNYVPGQQPARPDEGRIDALTQSLEYNMRPEIQKAAAMLSDAQAAIYPVDARGLIGNVLPDATAQSRVIVGGDVFGRAVASAGRELSSSLDNFKDLAEQTGGKAYYNRNDIDNAVASASQDGTSSYTLGYYTTNKKFSGEYRKLKVSVNRPGLQVRHRSGYFAYDPMELNKKKGAQDAALSSAIRSPAGYNTMVLFDAQVVPPAEGSGAPVPVTFLVNPKTISYEDDANGGKKLNVDLYAMAVGPDGRVAKDVGQTINTAINAEQYGQLQQQGLMVPLDLPLPKGDYTIKLAVRDNRTGFVGTVETPLSVK